MLRLKERPRAREAVQQLSKSEAGAKFLAELLKFWDESRLDEHNASDYLAGEDAIVSRGVSRCLGSQAQDLREMLK